MWNDSLFILFFIPPQVKKEALELIVLVYSDKENQIAS
jgi:hypothetical protein